MKFSRSFIHSFTFIKKGTGVEGKGYGEEKKYSAIFIFIPVAKMPYIHIRLNASDAKQAFPQTKSLISSAYCFKSHFFFFASEHISFSNDLKHVVLNFRVYKQMQRSKKEFFILITLRRSCCVCDFKCETKKKMRFLFFSIFLKL